MNVVVLGPPGAGKGTQCRLLAERLGVPHISTGELLREAIAKETSLGRLAKPFLDRGELVPDETMIELVKERLAEPDAAHGAILDGFPRTLAQARSFNRALDALGRRLDAVLYLKVPFDDVVERISKRRTCANCEAPYHLTTSPPLRADICDNCGGPLVQRPDDEASVVQHRLDVYEKQTAPLVDYYRNLRLLSEIDGTQSVERVFEDELQALGLVAAKT
jgi:adenylate kinase